jgi:hypothetical protein
VKSLHEYNNKKVFAIAGIGAAAVAALAIGMYMHYKKQK